MDSEQIGPTQQGLRHCIPSKPQAIWMLLVQGPYFEARGIKECILISDFSLKTQGFWATFELAPLTS